MAFWSWSKTASSNASADGTINWAEGQSPSSVNDSARAMMARTAEYRDDIAGALLTSGTSTAYTVASNQVFDTLAHMNGALLAFSPHATNGATVTLNVDGLGAKPLRTSPGVELFANALVLGTPYVATYSNADAVWYLQSFFGDRPYSVPLGSGLDYWGSTTPNSSWAFPTGQAISRATYATLFALIGTTYGIGDGSTTFNLPDKTGRVSAMKEATATRLTTAGGGVDGGTMGAHGGAQTETLLTANLPPYTPTGTVTNLVLPTETLTSTSGTSLPGTLSQGNNSNASGGLINFGVTAIGQLNIAAQGGTSAPLVTVQPTIVCNYIIRII